MRGVILTCCLLACGTAWAARNPMTINDLYEFQWVSDPQISPNGESVAFVLTVCDSTEGRDTYSYSVWISETGDERHAPRRLTSGRNDSAPRWSPNGRVLAFLRPSEHTKKPQIWLLSLEGGEALPLTDLPNGAGSPHWSPDGSLIAFNAAVSNPDAPGGIRVIKDPVFRHNGDGFKTSKTHIFTVNVKTRAVTQVTEGEYEEQFVAWSPGGSTLFFLSDRRATPWLFQDDRDLFEVRRQGGEWKRRIDIRGSIEKAALNSKGEWALVAQLNHPKAQSYNQLELLTTKAGNPQSPLTTQDAQNHTETYDGELGNYVATDMAPPRSRGGWTPAWRNNRKSVYVIVSEKGASNLARIDLADNTVTALTPGKNVVLSMSATPNAKSFAFVMADAKNPGDVWFADDKGNHLRRLTAFNDAFLARTFISGPAKIAARSKDGLDIDAWLIKPTNYEPWGKYPLIVQIHGGPHIAYGEHFFHEFQVMASRGYMVLYVNPRGSATYGEAFAQEIQYAYPGGDLYDILAAVDSVSSRSTVDGDRMGVTGGSGGGYLTNWMIVKDHRFKAAATQRCVSDWLSFFFTTDFSMYTPFWFQRQPWENPREYIERSPAYFAGRVRTPLLIIHSEDDLRTPINQGEAMFRALRGNGKKAVMVRIPGENHDLSRSGRPSHRIARLNYLLDWFDSYLQEKPAEWMATGD